jgi:hypothetical protein
VKKSNTIFQKNTTVELLDDSIFTRSSRPDQASTGGANHLSEVKDRQRDDREDWATLIQGFPLNSSDKKIK